MTRFQELLAAHIRGDEGAAAAYHTYLDTEPACTRLLREAQDDEDTYLWYARQDCEEKGYQWLQTSRERFVVLVAYALGALFEIPIEVIDAQIKAAFDADNTQEP